jgi:hypothetical protein
MVSVPERGLQLALTDTDQVTEPLPAPLAGEQVSQPGALPDAVQLQPLFALTVMLPPPPEAVGEAPKGEIE